MSGAGGRKNVILSHFSAEKMLYNNIYSYIMMLSVVQEVNDQSYSRFTGIIISVTSERKMNESGMKWKEK